MTNIVLDAYILKKDRNIRRRIEIDTTLYEKLKYLSKNVYEASINKMVNAAITELIKSRNVKLYDRPELEKSEPHNFLIRESIYKELEKLKKLHRLSIFKLVNIAIYNVLQEK